MSNITLRHVKTRSLPDFEHAKTSWSKEMDISLGSRCIASIQTICNLIMRQLNEAWTMDLQGGVDITDEIDFNHVWKQFDAAETTWKHLLTLRESLTHLERHLQKMTKIVEELNGVISVLDGSNIVELEGRNVKLNVAITRVQEMYKGYFQQTRLQRASLQHLEQIIDSIYSEDGIVHVDPHVLRPKILWIMSSWIHQPFLS